MSEQIQPTRFRMLPPGWAEMTAMRAGQKWRPSNGTEGEIFMQGWCAQCARDKSMREVDPVEKCDDDEVCEIIAATFRHDVDDPEYPVEWQYGKDGQPCCTAFIEAGQPVPPPRCKHTVDMFEGCAS